MSQKFSIVILIALMIAGCTSSGPSEAEIGTRVAAKFQAEATAAIALETSVAATIYAKQTANAPTPTPTPTDTPTPTPTPTEIPLGTSNLFIEYILDGSGSMYQQLPDGTTKLEVAQNLLTERLQAFRPETNIGLRVYGHRLPWEGQEDESCQDIELVAPVQPGQIEKIATWLESFEPKGMTPLAAALEQAVEDMDFDPAHINAIIMLSDGIESCGGDPCGLVAELQEQGINFKMHVIGLDVDAPTREQLACIAEAAGGQYHDADNQQDLSEALETVREDVTEDELIVPHGVDTPTPLPTSTPTETPVPTETPPPTPLPKLGEKIMFSADIDRNEEIYIMNVDGTELTRLTNYQYIDRGIDWSPDGSRILFLSLRHTGIGSLELYTMNIFGEDIRRITYNVSMDGDEADWSPDGSKIVSPCSTDSGSEICVMDLNNNQVIQITNTAFYKRYPIWSPDGTKIAFSGNNSIHIMNSDGTGLTTLVTSDGSYFESDWSPDGTRIAFRYMEKDNLDSDMFTTQDIYVINVDGSGQTKLRTGGSSPSWSPDSSKIVFHCKGNNTYGICTMNDDGTNVVQLTNPNEIDAHGPVWSPR